MKNSKRASETPLLLALCYYLSTGHDSSEVEIAFIIAHTRNNVVVLFGTLKVQSFMLT